MQSSNVHVRYAISFLLPAFLFAILPILCLCNSNSTAEPSIEYKMLRKLFITDYVKFHRSQRWKAPKLVYRFSQPHPGLGDRLNSLITAYLLAVFSNRILLLDWNVPYSFLDYFSQGSLSNIEYNPGMDKNVSEHICTRDKCKHDDLTPLLSSTHNVVYNYCFPTTSARIIAHHAKEFPKLKTSEQLQARTLLNFVDTQEPNLEVEHLMSDILETILKPGEQISHVLKTYSKSLSKPFVAVHARLGAGIGERGPRFAKVPPLKTLAKCFAKAAIKTVNRRREKGENNVGVYLATDTKEFRSLFEHELNNLDAKIRIVKTEQVEPVHTAKCEKKHLKNGNGAKGCLFTFVELMTISKAQAIVANKSSFSSAAAIMGRSRVEEIITWDKCR